MNKHYCHRSPFFIPSTPPPLWYTTILVTPYMYAMPCTCRILSATSSRPVFLTLKGQANTPVQTSCWLEMLPKHEHCLPASPGIQAGLPCVHFCFRTVGSSLVMATSWGVSRKPLWYWHTSDQGPASHAPSLPVFCSVHI